MHTVLSFIGWVVAIALVIVAVLLAMKKETGLKLIQHRMELLPQAMLVRYVAGALLAVIAAWIDAPRVLFAVLLMISVTGFGDAFIYRRAGHHHWMHLAVGGGALLGALIALFSIGGTS